MSVTQAGRGGMEWLAGVRWPSWATPYSAQATAALKAQFPTQWPTIQDYGFAHPELVPFINEDPMLVMSLIDGLGTRWLVGDGNSWIETDVKATSSTIFNIKVNKVTTAFNVIGSRQSFDDSVHSMYIAYNEGWINEEGSLRYVNGQYGSGFAALKIILSVGMHVMSLRPNKFILDGTEYNGGTNNGVNYNVYIMRVTSGGGAWGNIMKDDGLAYAEILNSDKGNRNFVPFVSTSRNGMLDIHDLEHPTFYPNAGTGTFTTSETPAS